MLIVKSTDGGASFGTPVKVSDYYDLPDCLTYTGQNAGRACVPTAPLSNRSIFRATNYPVGVAPIICMYLSQFQNGPGSTCCVAMSCGRLAGTASWPMM